nr:hypothetical protein Iba_chr03aCG20020 [Ipomoea batatas]GMC76031.1 hypothetical protein Iba_chr03dCG10440 [Ipomoea batatas]
MKERGGRGTSDGEINGQEHRQHEPVTPKERFLCRRGRLVHIELRPLTHSSSFSHASSLDTDSHFTLLTGDRQPPSTVTLTTSISSHPNERIRYI